MKIEWSMHDPGTLGVQALRIGVHPTQKKSADTPMATFMVTMMAQSSAFIHPFVRRSSVTAKAVLVHAMAVTVKVPRTARARTKASALGVRKSHVCRPKVW